jgi:hypothetical protein
VQIGNLTIVLPVDDPCAFEPSWRNSLAKAIIDLHPKLSSVDAMYRKYFQDKYVQKYVKYLRAESLGKTLTEEQSHMRVALMWYENSSPSGVRFRLEPLLLTGATMETIMLDISGGTVPVEVFTMYEKLFFNIRDEEGRLSKSCQLRQAFAMPNGDDLHDADSPEIWKAIAALMGYDVLMNVWMWKDAHGLSTKGSEFLLDETWRAAQSRLFMSVFADRVGHKSLGDILSAYTSQFKMLKEQKSVGSEATDTTRALMAVLYRTAPQMITVAQDVDALSDETMAIQSRINSQLAIDRQKIDDKGAAVSAAVVNEQIDNAVRS